MAITATAQRNHDALFPNHVSTPNMGEGLNDRISTLIRTTTLQSHGISNMEIIRNGSQPSAKGAAEYFAGNVRIDSPFKSEGGRVSGAFVTFEPGARSAWHTHPLGQTLIVTSGKGWTQCAGGPIVEINAGDIIWCPPGHKHWHGATPTTAMTHIAVQEAKDGRVVDWLEKVSDEEYLAGPSKTS